MDFIKAALGIDWKRVSLKKVSLHGLIGASTVYMALKAKGAPDSVAVTGAVISGLTSTYAGAINGHKPEVLDVFHE